MLRIVVLALMALSFGFPAHAAEEASNATPAESVQAKPKPRTEAEEKKLAEVRKKIDEKKKELNGSNWELLLSSSDPKINGQIDTFTFQNGQFNSKNFSGRGFVWTNYTITMPSEEGETAVWETMQTGSEGIIFIRGEWNKEMMNGNITEQLEEGKKVKDYTFTTASRKSIPPTSEAPADAPDTPTKALVSKEVAKTVAAFEPGTTDEINS